LLDFYPIIDEWAAFPRCRKRFHAALRTWDLTCF